MSRRRLLFLLALLLLPIIGFGVYSLMPPKPGATLANFRRLHFRMTREEVESILGPKTSSVPCSHGEECVHVRWNTDNVCIEITFTDDTHELWHGYFSDATWPASHTERVSREPESVREKIYRWIKEWTEW